MKRNELIQLLPVLQGLGIDPSKIKEQVIRQFDLPKSFGEEPPPAAPPQAQNIPQVAPTEEPQPALPAEQLAQQLAQSVPTPEVATPERM
jgi:hypothetical protein